jgi:hypothetical protein
MNRDPPTASRGIALRGPRLAVFDNALSGTELGEARAASRGNTGLGSKSAVSLSLRFGLQSMGFFYTCTGEATPLKRAAKRSIVWWSFDC